MIPTVDDDEVFELTNIKVREVSLVDRAANQRKFVVTKREDKKRSGDPITAEDAAKALEKAQENFADSPAAELDRKDAEKAAEAAKAVAVAPTEPVVTETVAPVIEPVSVANTTNSPDTITNEAVKAAEVLTAVNPDVPSIVETPAMDAFAAKMQAAWLGAIDAVRGRLDIMSEEAKLPYGYPAGHIYYIKCMLECMYDIGGAEWDIESAAMSAATAKSDDVTRRTGLEKIGKSILATRALRGQMDEMRKKFESPTPAEIVKNEPAVATVSETVVVAPVVAAVADTSAVVAASTSIEAPTFDITKDPAFKALRDSMTSQTQTIKSLEAIVNVQERELAKARSTVRSNALTADPDTQHNEVKWPRDMAASSKTRSR